eukprot:jgi/Psemu1/42365/gm1.42365_g
MGFHYAKAKATALTSCTSPKAQLHSSNNYKSPIIMNTGKVMIMFIGDCGRQPRRDLRNKVQPSLSHALFPSRCHPQLFFESLQHNAKASTTEEEEEAVGASTTGGNGSLASGTGATLTTTTTAAAAKAVSVFGQPKHSRRRHSLHRRSRCVFSSTHSPIKSSLSPCSSSSSSLLKTRSTTKMFHARKHHHHKRNNLALNAMDFDVLLRALMHRGDLGGSKTNTCSA